MVKEECAYIIQKVLQIMEKLSTLYMRLSSIYVREVLTPYCEIISRSIEYKEYHQEKIEQEERDLWDAEVKNQSLIWKKRLKSITEIIRKEENSLMEEEDRVDYRIDFGKINRELKEKEKQMLLKKDIIAREIFELRAQEEAIGSLWQKILKIAKILSYRRKIQAKKEEQKAIQRQLQEIRMEWEDVRKIHLLNRIDDMKYWEKRIVELGRLKMEKRFLENHRNFVESRWTMHTLLKRCGEISFLKSVPHIEKVPILLKKKEAYYEGKNAFNRVMKFLETLVENLQKIESILNDSEQINTCGDRWKKEDFNEISKLFDIKVQNDENSFEGLLAIFINYQTLSENKCLTDALAYLYSLIPNNTPKN